MLAKVPGSIPFVVVETALLHILVNVGTREFFKIRRSKDMRVYACDYVQALLALVVHTESPCAFGIKQKGGSQRGRFAKNSPQSLPAFPATLHENER